MSDIIADNQLLILIA